MVKTLPILFGLVFLAVGILGFIPGVTTDMNGMPMLLGIFHVNTAHNIVHIVSGSFSCSPGWLAPVYPGHGSKSSD